MSTTTPKRRRIKAVLLSLLALALAVPVALGVRYALILKTVDDGLKENNVNAVSPEPNEPSASVHPTYNLKTETILVLGSDIRPDPNNEASPGARSDTMMIVTISSDRKHITGVSIPRDLMVKDAPDCNIWNPATRQTSNEVWSPDGIVQSNAAFSMGGPRCAVKLAEHISGLKITRYIEVDFEGFKALVDAVGGVKVNICAPMTDSSQQMTLFDRPGEYVIDGEKALQFARVRYVHGDNGSDTSRMARQQYLLKQIIAQKISKETVLDTGKVERLAKVFIQNTKTDNIDSRFLIESAIASEGMESINLFTLPTGEWEYDPNRLIDDEETTRWVFSEIAKGNRIDGTKAQAEYAKNTGAAPEVNSSPQPTQSANTAPATPANTPTTATPSSPVSSAYPSGAPYPNNSYIPCGWGG